jgi:ornithine cyclodeaminase/alanine dehydrogenase-like protein (mu-crystallin family)
MDGILYLSDASVRACGIGAADVVQAIASILRARKPGPESRPGSLAIGGESGARFVAKAASETSFGFAAVKWFGISPHNRASGLPEYDPLILLNEQSFGRPAAILGARWISGLRTAALSAVAAQHLADPQTESIGFIGCGDQAHHHLDVLRAMFPIRRIKAFSRTSKSRETFCAQARSSGLSADPMDQPKDAVADVDLVVTAVPHGSSLEGTLKGEWVRPGAFVTMVDRGFSWDPSSLSAFSLALTDDVCLSGPGGPERTVWREGLSFDLADLLNGRLGPRDGAARTAFAFSGTALADLAAAVLVYERALALGLGDRLPR